MSATPACPAPRPLLAMLSDVLAAIMEPPQDAPRRLPATVRPYAGGYAAFDAPTYQRRGIRIAGLDTLAEPAVGPAAAGAPRPGVGALTVGLASSGA